MSFFKPEKLAFADKKDIFDTATVTGLFHVTPRIYADQGGLRLLDEDLGAAIQFELVSWNYLGADYAYLFGYIVWGDLKGIVPSDDLQMHMVEISEASLGNFLAFCELRGLLESRGICQNLEIIEIQCHHNSGSNTSSFFHFSAPKSHEGHLGKQRPRKLQPLISASPTKPDHMPFYNLVKSRFTLPFELYEFQQEVVNELAPHPRIGLWLDMGTGKTIVSIVIGLYKLIRGDIDRIIVLMPPILLVGWGRVLAKIPHVTYTIYRGTPKEREKLPLDKMFTLMSYQIFKQDKVRLEREFSGGRFAVICDESTAIKNVGSATYQKVRDFTVGQDLMLLSGSPLSSPHDGYAPIKLISPSIYRTLSQYERIHVAERNFFGQVTKWQNLDLLSDNLLVNSCRVLRTDVLKDLPPVTYTPMFYELDKAHLKTYQRLCAEHILKFDNGEKLDLTNASAMFHALQQIPMNREVFIREDGVHSIGVELIEETLNELGNGKLVVFTAYRATNRMLLKKLDKYGIVAVYGEVNATDQAAAIDRFVDDPECRVILLQLQSGGYGIDRLQSVCNDVLFAEMPLVPSHFHQAVARVWRAGQSNPVNVRVSIAEGTIQIRLWDVLQEKDSLVNLCLRGFEDMRDALAGRCLQTKDEQIEQALPS